MRQRERFMGVILMLVVAIYLASSTLFIHSHTIDGIVVVHSHPFLGSSSAHTHSDSSVDTIYRLTMPNAMTADGVAEIPYTMLSIAIEESSVVDVTYAAEHSISLLRAPPASV